MANLLEITDATFEKEVIFSEIPVLVDFWAVWCGPCKMVAPVVEEIAADYDGKLKVGKVDVDAHKQAAMKYGIRSIPTLLLFKDGKVVQQIIGALPKKQLEEKIKSFI
ncbi:thioredoxin [candidate division KSB1 bacterium]|nr:thioredoxin [candidate division KSB1 bacterium]